MKIEIVLPNLSFFPCCDLCRTTSFKISNLISFRKAYLISDLNKEETEEAKKRLPFFNKTILFCLKCVKGEPDQEKIWSVVLKMAVLPDLDPQSEYDFDLNSFIF